MNCIVCFHPNTYVTNSRGRKKSPIVWRRRHCASCGNTFSTEERPTLEYSRPVLDPETKQHQQFNPGRLLISIATSFQHDRNLGNNSAWALTQTIIEILSTKYPMPISTSDISSVTHQALLRYDKSAGMQYALRHRLITSLKRREY